MLSHVTMSEVSVGFPPPLFHFRIGSAFLLSRRLLVNQLREQSRNVRPSLLAIAFAILSVDKQRRCGMEVFLVSAHDQDHLLKSKGVFP
jgi:hypothetical protein